ncbi:MAG: PRC-barrel domain-containing protein [Planctomycetes bacterium]|nr:PRC-barrel domain-containing protein [Planctomycetota bacterium]
MSTTRLFRRGVLTLGLVALAVSGGPAAGLGKAATTPSYTDANAVVSSPSLTAPASEADLRRADRILHARVVSPQGKTLGRIHDIVLTPDLKGISYVAVTHDGVLGIGSTLHAIPWSALSPGLNRTYVAPITYEQFRQSRGFRASAWPSSAESVWPVASMDRTYSTRPAAYSSTDIKDRRFTHIRGSRVKGLEGRNVGTIHDLIVREDTGQIAYTVVSYGGVLGVGSRFAAVPENAITLEPALHVARVNASKTTLHANSFSPMQWPDLASPSYSQELARAFGVAPSGAALAYVPPGTVAAAPRATRPSARTPTPPAPGTAPTAPSAALAEPAPNELTGTFNPATITTIDGTVIDEGKFKATATGPDMIWLRVHTTDGRTVLVNLGPRNYVSTQDFYIVRGDQIHLTGSEVATAAAGRRVFLPTQVTYNSHVLRLRSETGTPLWEGQTRAPGAAPSTKPQSRAETSGTTALGYTPAEEPNTPAGSSLTSFAPAALLAPDALDLSKERTIDGTVTEVGKSRSPGGMEVVWLRLKTADGQTVNVQVGPRDYISKQGFFVVNGDRVHLTGWEARATGAPSAAPVFVAANLSQGGHNIQLRNREGDPLWTSPSGRAGQRSRGATGQTPTTQTPPSQTATPGLGATRGTTSGIAREPNKP